MMVLDGQMAMDFRERPLKEPPGYAMPCPIREACGAYGIGCGGERGWCRRAQDAGSEVVHGKKARA